MREHVGAVNRYARALTSDPSLAEDAVQETFVRAWKYQDSFRGSGSYQGWLLRICRNAVIDLAVSRRRHDLDAGPLTGLAEVVSLPSTASTLEIDDAIGTLAADQREVLVLCGVLGYDYESAAALLDVPIGTVRSRLHRARTALSAELRSA